MGNSSFDHYQRLEHRSQHLPFRKEERILFHGFHVERPWLSWRLTDLRIMAGIEPRTFVARSPLCDNGAGGTWSQSKSGHFMLPLRHFFVASRERRILVQGWAVVHAQKDGIRPGTIPRRRSDLGT
ncbi:hypothetical protein VTK56DRAFT_4608 [Thermocarpiscus australiensis]